MFWKILSTRSGDFGNFGSFEILEISELSEIFQINFGNFEKSEFLEILETLEILDFLEIWNSWNWFSGGLIVTHPMTDHALRLTCKGKVCQYSCPYLDEYQYTDIYIYMY